MYLYYVIPLQSDALRGRKLRSETFIVLDASRIGLMKIQCPNCQVEIPAEDINIAKGIAHCKPCNELIDVSLLSMDVDDVALVEKPEWSKVESFVAPDEMGLILPPLGLRGITWFFLLFTTVWNLGSYAAIFGALESGDTGGTLFMVPFIAVGAVTFGIFLYLLKAEVAILMDRQTVTLSRTIFGNSFTKVRSFEALRGVERVECYRSNDVPVYGIGLEFEGARDLKFGSTLKEEEKRWILSEITRFWASPSGKS